MSKSFNANFNIVGATETSPGIWEVTGDVIDYTLDGWSVTDVQSGDAFVDDNLLFGTQNRWKVNSVTTTGPSAYIGGNVNSIKLIASWDDEGEMDMNGPAAGIGLIARTSPNKRLMWNASVSLQLIPENVQNKVNVINNQKFVDPFDYKYVKNNTGTTLAQYKILAWENDGSVALANATIHNLSDVAGLSLSAIPDGQFGWIKKNGYVPGALASLSPLPGDRVYLSISTPGEMTLTRDFDLNVSIITIGRAEPPSGIASSNAIDLHMQIDIDQEI